VAAWTFSPLKDEPKVANPLVRVSKKEKGRVAVTELKCSTEPPRTFRKSLQRRPANMKVDLEDDRTRCASSLDRGSFDKRRSCLEIRMGREDLQTRGDCLSTRKSCKTASTVGWAVGERFWFAHKRNILSQSLHHNLCVVVNQLETRRINPI
jgi:hypothetical protein